MSSSTSSSRPRFDRRVLLLLVLCAFGLEVFTRTKLFQMSKDFRRFGGYGERAQHLVHEDGFRIALIGNSATDRGVDLPVFLSTIRETAKKPVQADLFVADQSRINTWQFMLERYFFRPELKPDLIAITFYEDDLQDGNAVEIGRLAQFFTTVADWPQVFRVDLPDLNQRAEFVLSSFWATFAARERIKERVLELLIPNYKEYTEQANAVNFQHNRRKHGPAAGAAAERPVTHAALRRLLDEARQRGFRLCFVAYPTLTDGDRPPYEVAPQTLALLGDAGTPYFDLRRLPELRPEHYADEVHLNESGKPLYSRRLAQALATLVK